MNHAFWTERRLKKTVFDETDFSGADLFKASLKGMDLSSCKIEGARVSEGFSGIKGRKLRVHQSVDLAGMPDVKIV